MNKYKLITLIMVSLMGGLLGIVLVKDIIRENSYTTVEAKLVDLIEESGATSDTDMMNYRTAVYEFSFENVKYEAKRSCFLLKNSDIGNVYIIRVDPKDPTIIENTYKKWTCIFAEGILILAILIILKSRE